MSVQYEILNKLVKLSGMKNRGTMSAAEIVALKKKENAKNRIRQFMMRKLKRFAPM